MKPEIKGRKYVVIVEQPVRIWRFDRCLPVIM
jgi:hypothetical protein